MTILRIDSSAQQEDSVSRQVTSYLVQQLGDHQEVVERDLARHEFPVVHGDNLMAIYTGATDPQHKEHLDWSEQLTTELLQAQTLVIGLPMYNFGVPSYLKQWIDYVCRAGITFRYTEQGPVGLTGIQEAYIVTASGGVPVGSDMDFASRYVEQVCRFLGVGNVHHIDAGGSKRDVAGTVLKAKDAVDQLLSQQAA